MSAIHDQIKQLTRTERLALVQDIWDDIAAEPDTFELTAAQAAELDIRLAEHRADPQEGGSLGELASSLGVRL